MKLVTYILEGSAEKVGVLTDDLEAVVDLSAAFPDMMSLIEGGPEALESACKTADKGASRVPLSEVRLKAPLPLPAQIRDCMAFEKHVRQAGEQFVRLRFGALARLILALKLVRIPKVWYKQPLYYKANRFAVIGPGEDVIWPSYSDLMDFECEFAAVIGKKGRDIPRDKARDHIFGYMVFNDMSARDAQFEEMAGRLGPAKGKDFDTANVFGPWLVTADEIPDPYDLKMIARVNGEEWSRGHSGDMHHKFEDMIAHISRSETLYPGEVIGSGTVGGGCGLELGRFLKPGDTIELAVDRLGVLRNRLVKP